MHIVHKLAGTPRPIRFDAQQAGPNSWSMAHAAPASSLTEAVLGYSDYWEQTGSFTTRRELPSLRAVLIVNLGGPISITGGDGTPITLRAGEGFVGGLHDRHALSRSEGGQQGIHIWLTMHGFQSLLGGAAGAIANQTVKLTDLLGARGAALGAQLMEAPNRESRFEALDRTLGGWLAGARAPRSDTAWAFDQLSRDPACRVADLASHMGCSRKGLSDRFRDCYGITPKIAARIARFERLIASCAAVAADQSPNWAGLALEAGYFDQSHMIRDFTAFAGLTPTDYRRRLLPGAGLIEC